VNFVFECDSMYISKGSHDAPPSWILLHQAQMDITPYKSISFFSIAARSGAMERSRSLTLRIALQTKALP
jgi:hypothetical protein